MDKQRNWGGARPGTGPKPKSFTLKLGDGFLLAEEHHLPCLGKVTEITRVQITLTVQDDGGQERKIIIKR